MLPKSLLPGKNCRGEPRSPAEKRSFSDFPKEKTVFSPCGDGFCFGKNHGRPRVAPTDAFLTSSNLPMLVHREVFCALFT